MTKLFHELWMKEWLRMNAAIKTPSDTTSLAELLDTYPTAIPAAKRGIKEKLKELKEGQNGIQIFYTTTREQINKFPFKTQPDYIKWLDEFVDRLDQSYLKEIGKYNYQLSYIENLKNPKKEIDAVDALRIARAKEVSITNILTFKGGNALCIFHEDRKPSLHYYPKTNTVHCFACGNGGDVIDVDMKLSGRTFRESVKHLAP